MVLVAGDTVIGVPEDELLLTREQKEAVKARLRSARLKLINGRNDGNFFRAARWTINIRTFQALLEDQHVPGSEFAIRDVHEFARWLERRHEEDEADYDEAY